MEGKVKWFNNKKGYGFIEGNDGNDYFMHYTALKDGARVSDGDAVSFDPVDAERGKQAQNVVLSSGGVKHEKAAPKEESAPKATPKAAAKASKVASKE